MFNVWYDDAMKPRHKILLILFSFAVVLLLLEVALRLVDPYGMSYFHDTGDVLRNTQDISDTLYILNPGTYHLNNFTLTVKGDHTRLVPDTSASDCIIVAIGDSVTMGHGVNDADTWVNQLALVFPDVQFINAGVNGYNSEQVLLSIDRFPQADGFVYYIVDNDVGDTILPKRDKSHSSYVSMYIQYALVRSSLRGQAEPIYTRFWQDIETLLSRDDLIAFNMADNLQPDMPLSVHFLAWHENISAVDGHPTANAHRALADKMQPYVQDLISRVCN